MPTLYLVGTPIGNLEDITLRALRILREVALIAAEDTRVTGRLLHHYGIETPMVPFHDFSSETRLGDLAARLQEADVALVSDAGMPGISDPAYRLVRAALEAGAAVTPIPGPTAAVAALVASGLPTDQFLFLGFLPRQKQARRAALSAAAAVAATLVIYESPHRLCALLADAAATLGNRPVVVARELTKLYEELWRGDLSAAQDEFGARERIRGEITLVIGPPPVADVRWDEQAVRAALHAALAEGLSRKAAARRVAAESGWRQRAVYALSLDQE
jgi:16S rRNA (cytidine1402-2'-O)-methyltransferase